MASLPKAKLAAINLYLGRAIICLSVLFNKMHKKQRLIAANLALGRGAILVG
jgi:hypothetical protein